MERRKEEGKDGKKERREKGRKEGRRVVIVLVLDTVRDEIH